MATRFWKATVCCPFYAITTDRYLLSWMIIFTGCSRQIARKPEKNKNKKKLKGVF